MADWFSKYHPSIQHMLWAVFLLIIPIMGIAIQVMAAGQVPVMQSLTVDKTTLIRDNTDIQTATVQIRSAKPEDLNQIFLIVNYATTLPNQTRGYFQAYKVNNQWHSQSVGGAFRGAQHVRLLGVAVDINGPLLTANFRWTAQATYGDIVSNKVAYYFAEANRGFTSGWRVSPATFEVVRESIIPPVTSTTTAANDKSPLGMNLAGADYWGRQWTFVDAMKHADRWLTVNTNFQTTGEEARLDLDAQGWVRSLPAATDTSVNYRYVSRHIYFDTQGTHPTGRYTVLYDGEGAIEYRFGPVKNIALSSPGRDVVDVPAPATGAFTILIRSINPQNHLRNIRVIVPGGICNNDPTVFAQDAAACTGTFQSFVDNYETQRFHPLFLADLKQFKVLRYLHLIHNTSDSLTFGDGMTSVVGWADRARLTDDRWNRSGKGIPPEVAIEMANKIKADPWITIPYQANDEYVTNFAQLAKDTLGGDQKIYLEYSNEIWNTAAPFHFAAQWVSAQADVLWPAPADTNIKRMSWYGKRSVEMCRIWKNVWGADSDRVVCAMGGMAGVDWMSEQALECPLWKTQNGGQACGVEMDALAIAPYFGGYIGDAKHEAVVSSWTQDADGGLAKLFTELGTGSILQDPEYPSGALAGSVAMIDKHMLLARRYSLNLIGYEGGQHIVATGPAFYGNGGQGNPEIQALYMNANRDARMGQMTKQYLDAWKAHGGEMMVYFANIWPYSRYGSWGIKESQTETSTPKSQALKDFIEANNDY